jgi:hypothetical protein
MQQMADWLQNLGVEQCAQRYPEHGINLDQACNAYAIAIKQADAGINYIQLCVPAARTITPSEIRPPAAPCVRKILFAITSPVF